MTDKESKKAIKILKSMLLGKVDYIVDDSKLYAINLAIQALEKQIPKKPDLKTNYDYFITYEACPTCGAQVVRQQNYCLGRRECEESEEGCGQAIDWN